MSDNFNIISNILRSGLEEWDVSPGNDIIDKFCRYYSLIVEKNKVMNLTSITDPEEAAVKHFLDSLAFIKASRILNIREDSCTDLIDVGTGAGFPGIPLKLFYKMFHVTLLDSLDKRVRFLNDVISELDLTYICAVHSRAEDAAMVSAAKADIYFREKFDVSVSRAVAPLNILCEYCIPFIKPGGYFICYKSGDYETELEEGRNAVKILGGEVQEVITYDLPLSQGISRSLIIIKKIDNTPEKYPRRSSKISKQPLY